MTDVMTWVMPIIVAVITGGFSYLGVFITVRSSHNQTINELKNGQDNLALKTEHQIEAIKEDIIRLEKKQDKHNSVIERTFKLEQKVEDLEKSIK